MDELRHLFTLSASAIDRARAFRAERMGHITSGAGAVPLTGNGRFILHIIPLSAVASTATLDAKQIYPHADAFRPLASSGFSPRYNLDGVISECGGVVATDRNVPKAAGSSKYRFKPPSICYIKSMGKLWDS